LGETLKKSLLASASVVAIVLASGAQAADLAARLAYKAPVLVPAPWSWTGFYVGANIGAVRGHSDTNVDSLVFGSYPAASLGGTSVIGGIQAGMNWQLNRFVFGIEGDLSGLSLNSSGLVSAFTVPVTYSSRVNWLATLRGRVGLAFDRALIYGTGGVAFADLKDNVNAPVFPFTIDSSSHATGWTAGGGIEYAFAEHWTAKVEYLHVKFHDRSAFPTILPQYVFQFKHSLDIGRVGINYKF
jgi:outer membrane immunogenic protein